MNMIWHNAIFVHTNSLIYVIQLINFFFYDNSNIRQGNVSGRTQFASTTTAAAALLPMEPNRIHVPE